MPTTPAKEIADALGGERIKGGYLCPCVVHEDETPSMKVSDGIKGTVAVCYAGCDVYPEMTRRGFEILKPKRVPAGMPPKGKDKVTKETKAKTPKRIVGTTPYHDAEGNVLYEVVRYEPKTFKARRPNPNATSNSSDDWIWDLDGITRVLYRLPTLIKAVKDNKVIFLCEGEKDVDNLLALGLSATTNQGGAAKWETQYTETLKGANVIILPDNDATGEKHVALVAPLLKEAGCRVRVLRLPGLPAKGDVSDWLRAGGTKEKLIALAKQAEEFEPGAKVIGGTEMWAAQYLVERHGSKIVSTPEVGLLVWDGKRFTQDEPAALMLTQQSIVELQTKDFDLSKKLQTAKGIRSVLDLAKKHCAASFNDFDAQPDLLNCRNGILDLRTGELRPHDPSIKCSKLLNIDFDINAKAPLWMAFLDRVMGGDGDMIDYLQRAAGYSLTGHTAEQVLFFLYGFGANGKSILKTTLQELAGEYSCGINKNAVMEKDKRNGGGIPNDIARLAQRRFVNVSETTQGEWFDEGTIKDLTGNEYISARFMRKEFFDFRPQFKLWLHGNHKPEIRGTDFGIWRRVHLVPFEVQIPEDERDKDLQAKLLTELPGILAWAVRGCFQWREIGLAPPEKVQKAVRDYRSEMDVIGFFISENCDLGAHLEVRVKEIYKVYQSWCDESGHRPLSMSRFNKALRQRGEISEGRDVGNYVTHVGIALKQQGSRYV